MKFHFFKMTFFIAIFALTGFSKSFAAYHPLHPYTDKPLPNILPAGVSDVTFCYSLNYQKLQEKWSRPIPQWMLDRIQKEWSCFKSKKVTQQALAATYNQVIKAYPNDTRYRIIDGQIYRQGADPYGFVDAYLRTLAYACTCFLGIPDLPNVDFIIHQEDGIPIDPEFDPPAYWICSNFEDQAPIFSYAKSEDASYVLCMPDRFTIPHWFRLAPAILEANKHWPWEKKEKLACWRGNPTDFKRHNIPNFSSDEIAKIYSTRARYIISLLSSQHPFLINAGFCSVYSGENLKAFLAPFIKEGFSEGHHLKYAYLPVLDGYSSAFPGYIWRLLSNSVAFKQQTTNSQWFYDALQPYVHYIPTKENLEDLVEKILWARSHDRECEQISKNAREFVLNHLMTEDMYFYQTVLFLEYAKQQDFDLRNLLNETISDPNWVRVR